MIYCRFYMNRKGLCSIQMVDAEFEYTYEYQGNAAKLVHTPLTDKCYLTLTQGQRPEYPGLFCCTCTYSENYSQIKIWRTLFVVFTHKKPFYNQKYV